MGKGYHFGLVKLEVKSKSSNGVEFTAGGNRTTDGGKVTGSLETKYKIKEHGLSLTEKWTTGNSLNTTVDYEKLVPGLKLTLDSSFKPDTGAKSSKLKADYKHEKLVFGTDRTSPARPWLISPHLSVTVLMLLATRRPPMQASPPSPSTTWPWHTTPGT